MISQTGGPLEDPLDDDDADWNLEPSHAGAWGPESLEPPESFEPPEAFEYGTLTEVMDWDNHFMRRALKLAEQALSEDEVPVGAIIVHDHRIIGSGWNQREALQDPTAHAEMVAITQAAASLSSWRLENCTLYVTLEPCPMCAGAILQSRIQRVVYGASDPKAGAVDSLFRLLDDPRLNHRAAVTAGLLGEQCGLLLSGFFQEKRRQGKK